MPTKLLSLPIELLIFHIISILAGFSIRRVENPNAEYFVVKMSSNGNLSELCPEIMR